MPQFVFSTAMTANQLGLNPLAGWLYEYLPWPASIVLLVRSTTSGNRITIFSGSENIRERTPVQGGGTAGVTPSELNTPADSWIAAAGDRLKLVIDEVLAGTTASYRSCSSLKAALLPPNLPARLCRPSPSSTDAKIAG